MESIIPNLQNYQLNKQNTINNIINTNVSFSKKTMFKVDEIIEKCKDKDGIDLLNFMCNVMHEKKRNMLEILYKELGKDYLVAMLEKTLNIENSGGLMKGKPLYPNKKEEKKLNENEESKIKYINEKKSTGGIFFSLIKKDPEAKHILNKATKLDWKESKQRKKVYKLLANLNI